MRKAEVYCLLDAKDAELTALRADCERMREELQVTRQLEESFWMALKELNLTHINVADPGRHITELHQRALAAESALALAQRDAEHWKKMYECAQNANSFRQQALGE